MQIVSTRIRSAEQAARRDAPAAARYCRARDRRADQPLPLRPGAGGRGRSAAGAASEDGDHSSPVPERKLGFFEFEPDVEHLLAQLIPLYAEAAIYAALLEASAAEHTSRQRAMSAATENAEELLKTLTRVMNRARQDSITTEIMEIVGGSEALRSAGDGPRDLTHPHATEEQNA